ncbi:MAG: type 4a pilus biogenesis protein PilO [Phycisphaerae bacterium]|nr:type 4a pilus biogenesis protein PilO [Phycisphaerae bacterium]
MQHVAKDTYLTLGILAAMITAAVTLVYTPQSRKIDDIRTRIASRKVAAESESRQIAIVPDLMHKVEQLKSRYKNFDRKLPKSKELAGFLREISGELAKDSNLVSEKYQPGSPSQEDLFHTLPIKMELRGSFLSLARFLKRIENMERLARVEKLIVEQRSDEKEELKIEMRLNIYFTES